VLNSLTKLKCLVCQTGLSDFGSSNFATSFIKFHNRLFTLPPLGHIKGLSPVPANATAREQDAVTVPPTVAVARPTATRGTSAWHDHGGGNSPDGRGDDGVAGSGQRDGARR
jgi:hypothetical protein